MYECCGIKTGVDVMYQKDKKTDKRPVTACMALIEIKKYSMAIAINNSIGALDRVTCNSISTMKIAPPLLDYVAQCVFCDKTRTD